jgi:putative SOS response-associated peptidase YedK
MCGRFGLAAPEFSETRFGANRLPEAEPLMLPRFNIAPTQDVLTVAVSKRLDGARALKAMRWGLVADWAVNDRRKPRPINLKVENLLDRPNYRWLLERRRCIIPADGFYEWEHAGGSAKQPWNIGLRDGPLFGFAGVWTATKIDQDWLVSCAILTTTPNELVAKLHDRMPVILAAEDEEVWLAGEASLADLVPCLKTYPAGLMDSFPVSPAVGDVNNEGPGLRQPAAAQQTLL